jgi:hypothetical protein
VERSDDTDIERRRTRKTRRVAKGFVAVSLAIVTLAVLAPAAWAHTGSATATCKKVVYTYADFPVQPNDTVHESVFINGILERTDTYVFTGPKGKNTVRIVVSGSATVEAKAQWNTNGAKGSFVVTQDVAGCVIG